MNEDIDIIRFLNRYKDDPDPQYAVLLDGKWGCGKTFFIKGWLDTFQTENEDECKQSLRAVLRTLIKIYTFAPNFKFGTK